MTGQFAEIHAYQCKSCGAVLTTATGMRRHAERCRYSEPQVDGQIAFYNESEGHDCAVVP